MSTDYFEYRLDLYERDRAELFRLREENARLKAEWAEAWSWYCEANHQVTVFTPWSDESGMANVRKILAESLDNLGKIIAKNLPAALAAAAEKTE